MELIVTSQLEDDNREYWSLYQDAFQTLRAEAVQRHLMFDTEFKELMADPRVTKYLVRDEVKNQPVALTTLTNDLDAVPLISPDYFAHKYPELFAQKQIWYNSFVAVAPEYQGSQAMSLLIERLCQDIDTVGGMFVLDICEHKSRRLLAMGVERMAGRHLPGLQRTRLDAQVFWGYEFPAAEVA
jgi:hypothetical protein